MPYILVRSKRRVINCYKPLVTGEALLVSNGVVVATGDYESLKKSLVGEDYEVVESGNVLAPGFVDAHAHPDSLGYNMLLGGSIATGSLRSLLERVAGESRSIAGWVIAPRVDPSKLEEGRMPYSWEIDAFIDDKPVLIQHVSGHMATLNKRGLELALSILGSIKYGDLEKGWIYEDDLWRLLSHIRSSMSETEISKALLLGLREFEAHGVTAVGAAGLSQREINIFLQLDSEGKLPVRVYGYIMYEKGLDMSRVEKLVEETWSRPGRRFRVNGLKIILDGALGPRTAFLSSEYNDAPGRRGFLNYNVGELESVLEEASRRGIQVAVHVIGDGALDMVIKALRKAGNTLIRLEHVSLVRDDQLTELKTFKPILVLQPHFIISDSWITRRLGWERASWVYRLRDLAEASITAYSTDAPVEPVNPFETICAALTRGSLDGIDYSTSTIRNSVTVLEALGHYTVDSAVALGDPRLGCLLPGCYADIVELSEDPIIRSDPVTLRQIKANVLKLIKGYIET